MELLKLRERVLVARRDRAPLQLRGAGTKDFYGEADSRGAPLDLRGYRGIIDYEPSELVISARCGTPLSEIESALAQSNQCLGFEPPAFGGDPTIGGVIAAGLSGPRRMQAGAARDFVLGATLLSGDGELLKFGGRVMKNVAGFDVSRLLCGSLGIFGVIADVSLKVLPVARAEVTLRMEMTAAGAIKAFNQWGGQPLPISAAAWYDGMASIRLSGAEPAVRAACARLGGEELDEPSGRRWWDSLRNCSHAFFSNPSIWRLSVPSTASLLPLQGDVMLDWGGALRWYAGRYDPDEIRKVAMAVGGTALCWKGPANASRFHPLQPVIAEIHRRLKQHFDPEGIFNPGRLLAGL